MESFTYFFFYFQFPVTCREFGPIDYIDVMPVEPNFVAVSCAARVQIYNPITHQVQRHFTRFKEAAYGGSFRSDGKLLIAGTEEGHVKLFDVGSSKSLLRVFKGHNRYVLFHEIFWKIILSDHILQCCTPLQVYS